MRFTRVGYALGIAAAVAVFAGCSSNGSSSAIAPMGPVGGSQSVVRSHPVMVLPGSVIKAYNLGDIPSRGRNWQGVKPDATTTYITGCQFFGVNCNLYVRGKNVVVGTIAASYVNGLCTDKAGNVWIPDGGAQTISEYPHGSTTASFTLSGTGVQPSACAVAKNGTVYIGDIAAAKIDVYHAGSTTSFKSIKVKSLLSGTTVQGYIIGIGLDENNLLAVSWINFSTGTAGIDEYPGAKQSTEHTVFTTTDFPGAVVFDNAENLVFNDQTTATVDLFPNAGGTMTCSFPNDSGDATMSALDKANEDAYEPDAINNAVEEISYSSTCTGGGTLEKTYNKGFASGSSVSGAAVSPGNVQ